MFSRGDNLKKEAKARLKTQNLSYLFLCGGTSGENHLFKIRSGEEYFEGALVIIQYPD